LFVVCSDPRTKLPAERSTAMQLLSERQTARSRLRLGPVRMKARVDVTPAGLLTIGALVCGILLSTSVLVATAVREARR